MPALIAQFLGFLLYPLGMAALGYAVGWTVGLSNTPVVAAMLPVVFGLVAGGAGIWLGRGDLAEPVERGRFGVLGASLLLFALAAMHGTKVGLADRAERDRGTVALDDASADPAGESAGPASAGEATAAAGDAPALAELSLADFPLSDDPTEAIEALVLRRQLAAVGATQLEQQHVLMAVALEALERPSDAATAKRVRSELAVDTAIVTAGLDASRREGPLADAATWDHAAARLRALIDSDGTASALASERAAILSGLVEALEAGSGDGGPALRASRGAVDTRVGLARADADALALRAGAEAARADRARAALAELVEALDEPPAPPSVTIIERTTHAPPAARTPKPPTAFGTPPSDS